MKKTIILLLAIFTFSFASAQGNLQFNQVLNLDFSTFCDNENVEYSAGSFTVPNNKVWKITYSSVYSSTNPSYSGALKINNIMVNNGRINPTNNNNKSAIIWLQAGNYNVSLFSTTSSNQAIVATLSVVEFNIVQ